MPSSYTDGIVEWRAEVIITEHNEEFSLGPTFLFLLCFLFVCFLFFAFSRATPTAYGGSQAGG